VLAKLDQIKQQGVKSDPTDAYVSERIEQLEKDPTKFVPAPPVEAPPGMPIGDEED
jgi:hypothetical protein